MSLEKNGYPDIDEIKNSPGYPGDDKAIVLLLNVFKRYLVILVKLLVSLAL